MLWSNIRRKNDTTLRETYFCVLVRIFMECNGNTGYISVEFCAYYLSERILHNKNTYLRILIITQIKQNSSKTSFLTPKILIVSGTGLDSLSSQPPKKTGSSGCNSDDSGLPSSKDCLHIMQWRFVELRSLFFSLMVKYITFQLCYF